MQAVQPPALGAVAPDVQALDANGSLRRLADLCAEHPLVLVFYRGHW
jgi:peroxiredoxin